MAVEYILPLVFKAIFLEHCGKPCVSPDRTISWIKSWWVSSAFWRCSALFSAILQLFYPTWHTSFLSTLQKTLSHVFVSKHLTVFFFVLQRLNIVKLSHVWTVELVKKQPQDTSAFVKVDFGEKTVTVSKNRALQPKQFCIHLKQFSRALVFLLLLFFLLQTVSQTTTATLNKNRRKEHQNRWNTRDIQKRKT